MQLESHLFILKNHYYYNSNHNIMKQTIAKILPLGALFTVLTFLSLNTHAQAEQSAIPRDTLLQAAFEIMKATPFCALVTIDSTGQPQVRTMNPFPLKNDMVIWFATARNSRKVSDIRKNPKVSVYFADHTAARGYVSINGTAIIIDDKELLLRMKREYWESIPNWQDRFVLIKITPKNLDVTNYARGISGDPVTSRAPHVVF
jgi:general stress protein 26